jgi:hypothetical protein
MTEPAPIFRREALDFRSGVRRDRTALQLGGPWSGLMYGLVLVLGVVAVAIGWAVRADVTTSGPALLDARAGTFTALVPVAAGPEIRGGQPARLRLADATAGTVAAEVRDARVIDGDGARRAGFASMTESAVLVSGVLAGGPDVGVPPSSGGQEARAEIVLRSDRFIDLLLDGVAALFGRGGEA